MAEPGTVTGFRQPWYPVEERYGLVFAYMGPPEKKPVLPRFDALEELDPGELIDVDDTSIGSGEDAIAPCNWLQHFENVMDPLLEDGTRAPPLRRFG
jgi:phenylpropionate dioxygenase-like ring-hydroxylating dioxygenase large terminal subunit